MSRVRGEDFIHIFSDLGVGFVKNVVVVEALL
jgi:hypothetical protein